MSKQYHISVDEYRPRSRTPSSKSVMQIFRQELPVITKRKPNHFGIPSGRHHGLRDTFQNDEPSWSQMPSKGEEGQDVVLASITKPVSRLALTSDEEQSTREKRSDFLQDIQARIDHELLILEADGSSSLSRLRIFQEAGKQLEHYYQRSCGPVLSRVFKEFAHYVDECQEKIAAFEQIQRDANAEILEQKEEIGKLKEALCDAKTKFDAELEAMDKKVRGSCSIVSLIRTVDDLTKKLENERQINNTLQTKLSATSRVKSEFERVIGSIEETFKVVNDEKDLEISKLRLAVQMERESREEEVARERERAQRLQHTIDTLEIALTLRQQRDDLHAERAKDMSNRNNDLHERLQRAEAEAELLEERLAHFEGTIEVAPKDIAVTPRPSKAEAVRRIPELGDVTSFTSTNAMMNAIYDHFDQLHHRAEDSEEIIRNLEVEVSQRLQRSQGLALPVDVRKTSLFCKPSSVQ